MSAAIVWAVYEYFKDRFDEKPVDLSRPRYSHAVSYTHLRAHETVLELVCRLLLEKKNESFSHTAMTSTYTAHKPSAL